MSHQYVVVLNQGSPLILVRMPLKGKPGNLRTATKRAARARALTKLMREHGMRQRDVLALDNASHPDSFGDDPMLHGAATRAEARAHHEKLDRAFAEGTGFADFWLYDWHEEHGFVLVRRPRFVDGARVVLTEDYPFVTLDRQVATMPAGSVGTVVQMGIAEERFVVFGEIPVVPMNRAVAVRTSALREEEPSFTNGKRVVLTESITRYVTPPKGEPNLVPAGSEGTIVEHGDCPDVVWVVFGEVPLGFPMDDAVAVNVKSLRVAP